MSALCILAAGKASVVAASLFTLSWEHSVEKVRWEEDWRVTPAGLEIVEARVKGSGAGMEPPEGSTLVDGWWVYAPVIGPVPELVLAASGATSQGWLLCTHDDCMTLGAAAIEPVRLAPCPG
jgi:hypothetical protein